MSSFKIILALLLLLIPAQAERWSDPGWTGAVVASLTNGGGSYTPYAAGFDGVNDYLEKSGVLSALSDANTYTLSFWIRFNGGDAANQLVMDLYDGSNNALRCIRNTTNSIAFTYRNASANVQVEWYSTPVTVASGWTHVFIANNATTARRMYINGVDSLANSVAWLAGTADVNSAGQTWRIGASAISGSARLNADISEFWFDDTYVADVTKFRTAGGSPVNLGSDGSNPKSGTPPAIYLSRSGSGNSWANDSSGNLNNFSVTGSLDSPTPP